LKNNDEALFLSTYDHLISEAYTAPLPAELEQVCKAQGTLADAPTVTVTTSMGAAEAGALCDVNSICVVAEDVVLTMDGSLNVGALVVKGEVIWDETTQLVAEQWLCAGYVAVEDNGSFDLIVTGADLAAYIYIKDNGLKHESLRSRAFGGVVTEGVSEPGYPRVVVAGRPMARTWSLLAFTVPEGADSITLVHDVAAMGWTVGDRVAIASTTANSLGHAQAFTIQAIAGNTISLASPLGVDVGTGQTDQEYLGEQTSRMQAEVINLKRNVVLTGDDFTEVPCTSVETDETKECVCDPFISRSSCTVRALYCIAWLTFQLIIRVCSLFCLFNINYKITHTSV
jgi:hypothetical protein